MRDVYKATAKGAFAKDFGLRDQIRRASVSVMSNVAEGHGRGGRKEFLQFLSMAQGSVNEVCSHLYVASDLGYIDGEQFRALRDLAYESARLIGGLARYLRTTSVSGVKFRVSGLATSQKPQTANQEQEITSQEPGTRNYKPKTTR